MAAFSNVQANSSLNDAIDAMNSSVEPSLQRLCKNRLKRWHSTTTIEDSELDDDPDVADCSNMDIKTDALAVCGSKRSCREVKVRKSKVQFAQKMKDLISSPNYGDGLSSNLSKKRQRQCNRKPFRLSESAVANAQILAIHDPLYFEPHETSWELLEKSLRSEFQILACHDYINREFKLIIVSEMLVIVLLRFSCIIEKPSCVPYVCPWHDG